MTGGRPDRCAENQGCLVWALAFGQFGWQHPGCRRQPGQREAFGRPSASRGTSAYPQVRFVSLVESGTHVLFGTQMSGYRVGEITLAHKVLPALKEGMLCLADRNFYGYDL